MLKRDVGEVADGRLRWAQSSTPEEGYAVYSPVNSPSSFSVECPSLPNVWEDVPHDLFSQVFRILDKSDKSSARSVGQWWCRLGGLEVDAAHPKHLDVERLRESFPCISTLKLHGCPLRSEKELLRLSSLEHLRALYLPCGFKVDSLVLAAVARGAGSKLRELHMPGCRLLDGMGMQVVAACCSGLQHLNIACCSQLGDEALLSLTRIGSLQSLNMSLNSRITDAGLHELASLTCLTSLHLSGCHLITDAGLSSLARLISLEVLDLEYCQQITSTGLRQLRTLQSLSELKLSDCVSIDDGAQSAIFDLKALTELDMAHCWKVCGDSFGGFTALRHLSHLNLANCWKVSSPALALLGELSLRSLNVRGCKLDDASFQRICRLPLTSLDMSACALVSTEALLHLAKLTQLQKLHMSGCNATDEVTAYIRKCAALTDLNLDGCQVSDTGLATLSRATALRSLSLQGCDSVGDLGLVSLACLSDLRVLVLAECQAVTNAGVAEITSLPHLGLLDLSGCWSLTDGVSQHLLRLRCLEMLSLRDCPRVSSDVVELLSLRHPRLAVDSAGCGKLQAEPPAHIMHAALFA